MARPSRPFPGFAAQVVIGAFPRNTTPPTGMAILETIPEDRQTLLDQGEPVQGYPVRVD